MTGVICGTGSYVPEHVMDNYAIAELVETSDEWIQERTGVIRRCIIEEETTVSMASIAAKRALENSGIKPEEIDLILVATISSNVILPCAACEVQKEIQAVNALCFDINAACTGFVLAYNTAQAYIAAGMYKTVLIVGSESLSNLTNWEDRGTCILFGDGAGAAVVKAQEGQNYKFIAYSDGRRGEALTCVSRHTKHFSQKSLEETYMKMDGQSVFKFAVKKVPEIIKEVLELNQLTTNDIDYFILHQANKRIVESVAKRLDVEIDRFPMNLQEYGNTSSASIPILLDELSKKEILKKGQKIMLGGFGAGLTWGANILEWN